MRHSAKAVTGRRIEILTLAAGVLLLTACASGGGSSSSLPSLPSPSSSPSLPSVSPPSAPSLPSPPSASLPSAPKPPSLSLPTPGGECKGGDGQGGSSGPDGAQTAEEKRASLDSEFDASLAETDRMLLQEKETLAQNRPEAMNASSSGGGSSSSGSLGGLAGAAGSAASSGGSSDGNEASSGSGGGATDASGDSNSAPVGSHSAPGSEKGTAEKDESSKRVPADIPDGRDDDIVARQLREAATSEDDPELREKLWNEYRKYKSGRG